MALSPDQAADVAQLLSDKPELTNNEIRQELGLPGSALFSIKAVRRQLGVAEPAGQERSAASSKRPGRRRSSKRGAQLGDVETETLDDGDQLGEPSGPKRRPVAPKSMLAPVLPRIAQSLMVGIQAGTYHLTRGVAPMSPLEAKAIAIPAMNIVDRTAAKYIKRSGKVTPNQEDFALIALTVSMWALGWIVATFQGRKPQPRDTPPAAAPENDLFSGSEPSAPAVATVPTSPAASAAFGPQAQPIAAPGLADDSDLFAGSEPLAAGAQSAAQLAEPTPLAGPRRGGTSEAMWQAIMPTDLGESLVG